MAGMAIRDEGMADNLDFLLDTQYPKRKFIVWAHNAHIAREGGPGMPKMMGAHVGERRKDEVYTIGLYMNRGAARLNDQKIYQIAPAGPGSMEAVLANGGVKYAFIDFSGAKPGAGTDWIFKPVTAREWGTRAARITPANSYDAVIYIDTVTPPAR
jgi:erythromycin esterase